MTITQSTNLVNFILCRQSDINYKVWYNYHFLGELHNQLNNNLHMFHNPAVCEVFQNITFCVFYDYIYVYMPVHIYAHDHTCVIQTWLHRLYIHR